jgi:alpha-beta hydrolase superfamily lysophospholipase
MQDHSLRVVDSFATAPPAASSDEALDQAMLRAYPIERAVDYGCLLDDVLKLHRRVAAGHGWADVALQLADDHALRSAHAQGEGQTDLAARCLLYAAACLRVGQAGLEHEPACRLQVYERQARIFSDAMQPAVTKVRAEYIEVEHQHAGHGAWLFRAPAFHDGMPTVVVWGGADGWCEAFHASVAAFIDRGLSVCLLELPGQGLARLRNGSMLGTDFTRIVSKTLDVLVGKGAAADRFGVLGHSAGGSLAIVAAATEERIRACCSNGGPAQLRNLLRYPRVLQRFGRMLGGAITDAEVFALCDHLDVEYAAKSMRASLLCLQGGQDPLVTDEEARRLVALRGPDAAALAYWPDGAHCVYNHAFERNCVVADWLAFELA